MKALTLLQPHATLIAIGAKRMETRSWATHYRGPLAIHAASVLTRSGRELCATEPFRSTLTKAGYSNADMLPLASVVAIAELVDCLPMYDEEGQKSPELPPPGSAERTFGSHVPGRFMWRLGGARVLRPSRPGRGAQGLWDWP
jgi:activating signal cointegrator 1